MFTIRFDMRAPAFGAPTTELYAAAIDMSAWAEQHGCLAAVLCEHHGSEDGYLPAPLLLASAMAARTDRLALSLVVILPFHDPVRLAEEIAVLDLISAGRASYVFGLGYRRRNSSTSVSTWRSGADWPTRTSISYGRCSPVPPSRARTAASR